MGLSATDHSLDYELNWYMWYLTPDGLRALPQLLRSLPCDARRAWNGSAPEELNWDTRPWKLRRKPRCDTVDVQLEPPSGSVEATPDWYDPPGWRLGLSTVERAMLDVVEREAGHEVTPSLPLASVFDSLKMMGFVLNARKSLDLGLSLREVLQCDTIGDLLALVKSLVQVSSGSGEGGPSRCSRQSSGTSIVSHCRIQLHVSSFCELGARC